MKAIAIICVSAVLATYGSCLHPRSEQAMSEAHRLADAGTLVITFIGNGTSHQQGRGTLCSGLDIAVSQVGQPPDQFLLCFDTDHPQYTEIAALREGDRIRFDFLDRTGQSRESKEAYLIFSRFNKSGMKL